MSSEADDSGPIYPIRFSEAAEADIEATYNWIGSRDFAAAERWLAGLQDALAQRAADHAALPGRRYVAADAANFPGRDMRVLRYQTRGGSTWRVLYELRDEDGDGDSYSLVVAYVRSASRPAPGAPGPDAPD
jgi:plasmid stabilization system protein ParE